MHPPKGGTRLFKQASPWERDEGMSAHPDRVPGSVLTEQWCGPLCPSTSQARPPPAAKSSLWLATIPTPEQ